MSKHLLTHVLLGCVLALQGCSLFSPVKAPDIKTYSLMAKPGSGGYAYSSANKERVLLVSTPTASPGFDTSQMAYTKKPYQLSHFGYNEWVAPPSRMLLPLLIESIENTHCFDGVVMTPPTNATTLTLQTNITELQQEFVGDKSICVRMSMGVTLSDNVSGAVSQRRFEVVVPTEANTPYAGVVAANKAVAIMLRKINGFVCRGVE